MSTKTRKWEILARHKWVSGCTITETHNNEITDISYRRMIATIRGWRNFLIYEGDIAKVESEVIRDKVLEIRERIDNGDEKVFYENHRIIIE